MVACSASSPTAPEQVGARSGNTTTRVVVAVAAVRLAPCPTTTVQPGAALQLTATAHLADETTQDVTSESLWVSTNRGVAIVENGHVTALASGLTVISANFHQVRGSCQFVVDTAPPPPPLPPSSDDGVVISELRTRGPKGADDEFIELHNASAHPVNVGSWRVAQSAKSGPVVETIATLVAGLVIDPGCYFLLTRGTREDDRRETYGGSIPGDATFVAPLLDDGGIALIRPDGAFVDAVGMSLATLYKEGMPLASFGPNALDRSYQRIGADSNDNMADFRMTSPSAPVNRKGVCHPPD